MDDSKKDLDKLVENFDKCIDFGLRFQEKGQGLVNLGKLGKGVAKHFSENYESYERITKDFPETKDDLNFISKWTSYGNKKLESNIQGLQEAEDLASRNITDITSVCLTGSSGYSGFKSDVDEIRLENDLIDFDGTYPITIPSPPIPYTDIQQELDILLDEIGPELNQRRKGAWYVFHSGSPDKQAQAAHSMRDVLSVFISRWASNEDVKKAEWWKYANDTEDGVSLRQRIRFLLYGPYNVQGTDADVEIVEQTVAKYLDEDRFLKKVAHGSKKGTAELIESTMHSIESALLSILNMKVKYSK